MYYILREFEDLTKFFCFVLALVKPGTNFESM